MKSKGFTLVELLAVIAILGLAAVFISTNFFHLIGNAKDYEYENIFKYLNEAAYACSSSEEYITVDKLLGKGCIDQKSGLLKDFNFSGNGDNDNKVKATIKVTIDAGEKKTCVSDFSVDGEEIVVGNIKGGCGYDR